MSIPISIRYPFRPVRRSLATGVVADLFGLGEAEPPHVVAENLVLDVRAGDVVLFVGPSGSGKSSLLRVAGERLGAVDAGALELPDEPLVDALSGPVEERLRLLAACGLSEARLLLRTPAELSDGQRYRFRIALASSVVLGHSSFESPRMTNDQGRRTILLDEFAAPLDRTLAKVVAFNLRKLATRTGVGVLAATTHWDVLPDLNPDVVVRCEGDGVVTVRRRRVRPRAVSFAKDLRVTEGAAADWTAFAKWHYRSHTISFVRKVVVLRHGRVRVGVCVFAAPAASLAARRRFFGLPGTRDRLTLAALNDQIWCLARVVLHPTYRGAGVAADFVRAACRRCPVPWVETLTAMGRVNPVFERAGFVWAGEVGSKREWTTGAYSAGLSAASRAKGRFGTPEYYVFDNRGR